MTLEIIHTDRAYIVIDNERGRWDFQFAYGCYLNARKFALTWKAAAKLWRARAQVRSCILSLQKPKGVAGESQG